MKKFLLAGFILLISITGFTQTKQKAVSDTAQVKNTLIGFFKWYNLNWKKFMAFKLYKSKSGKEGPPYIINWHEVDRYSSFLRNSVPYMSEAFIANEKKRFQQAEEEFKQHPEDEVPSEFDYDHFTGSQEDPKWFLSEFIKKSNVWTITLKNDTASVAIQQRDKDSPYVLNFFFCGDLVKEKGKWKIARLDCNITTESQDNN